MFQFGWYLMRIPLTLVFFELILLVITLSAASDFALLPSLFMPFLSPPLFLSLLERVQWSAANKSVFVFYAFVCLHVSDCSNPVPPPAHRSDSITGIWVNALYALRCRSKGPQRAGLRPQNWRKQQQQQQATSPLGFDLWMCRWIAGPCGPANLLFFAPSPAPLVACTDGVCS